MRGIFLCILVLSTCGRAEFDRPANTVDPRLKPYMDKFYADAANYGLTPGQAVWSLTFDQPSNEEWIGECTIKTYEHNTILGTTETIFRTIVIVPDMDPLLTQVVVNHEMGHCAYGLPHSDNEGTLMYPIVPNITNESELHQLTIEMFDTVSTIYQQRR